MEKTSQLLQSTTKVPETHIAAVKNTREVFEDDPNIWIQVWEDLLNCMLILISYFEN